MPWDDIARRDYARRSPRYASDLTDREWALIAPFLPSPRPIGRPRTTDLREVVNAILYMASTGCQWRMLPKDLPPASTVQRYFYDWRDRGLWRTISNHLAVDWNATGLAETPIQSECYAAAPCRFETRRFCVRSMSADCLEPGMIDGKLVLYVECLVCRHVGQIPQADLDPDVLPVHLKPSLRCSHCGTLGEVEVRLGWSGGGEALKGAGGPEKG